MNRDHSDAYDPEPIDPREVLDAEELADYYRHRAQQPSRGGSDAMVRRARAERGGDW